MTHVPLVDLEAHHRPLLAEMRAAIDRVIQTGRFILSEPVASFEEEARRYFGTAFAVGVGSGLDALRLSLAAINVGPGDQVIIPANTYIATALAVSAVGAAPVLVDCRSDTLCLDATLIERAITPRTRAIIPVHLYGQSADMTAVLDLADRHRLAVIEDAAQAHGGRFDQRLCGSMGRAGCFSFYPSKNLGAIGDGGLVVTNDPDLADRVRALRHYGQREKDHHAEKGINSRLDAIQAAVLSVKLPHLDDWNRLRRDRAARYRRRLEGSGLSLPQVDPRVEHVYHVFAARSPVRDRLRTELAALGIETGVHYPRPIHLTPAYRDLGLPAGSFPEAERASREILSLPMYPELADAQIDYVADAVARVHESPASRS